MKLAVYFWNNDKGGMEEKTAEECAKCGGTPKLEKEFKTGDHRYWIRCMKCGMHSAWHHEPEDAFKDWNERMKR